jgi:hypothetical protein
MLSSKKVASGYARVALLLGGIVLGAASATCVDARERVPPAHGLWVWKGEGLLHSASGERALLAFCRSEKITEVYLSIPQQDIKSEDKAIGHFVEQLHGANVRAEALVSSTTADLGGTARAKLMEHVRAILRFDALHADQRFDGIHIDVEPQQRTENKGEGNLKFLPGLVDTFHEIRALAEPRGLTVSADIQGKLLKGDPAQRRALLSALPRFTLMMYELSSPADGKSAEEKAAKARDTSQEMLARAYEGLNDPGLARMAIALRTADYGKLLPQMLQALDDANTTNPHYLGWARHSYNDVAPR